MNPAIKDLFMHPSFPNAIPQGSRNVIISKLGGHVLARWPFPAKSFRSQGVPHSCPSQACQPRHEQTARSLSGCNHPMVSTTWPSHPYPTSFLLHCCGIPTAAAFAHLTQTHLPPSLCHQPSHPGCCFWVHSYTWVLFCGPIHPLQAKGNVSQTALWGRGITCT